LIFDFDSVPIRDPPGAKFQEQIDMSEPNKVFQLEKFGIVIVIVCIGLLVAAIAITGHPG